MNVKLMVYRVDLGDGQSRVSWTSYHEGIDPVVRNTANFRRHNQKFTITDIIYEMPAYTAYANGVCAGNPDYVDEDDGESDTTDANVVLYVTPRHIVEAYGMHYGSNSFTDAVDFCPYDLIEHISDPTMHEIVTADGYDCEGLGVEALGVIRDQSNQFHSFEQVKNFISSNSYIQNEYIGKLPSEHRSNYEHLLALTYMHDLGG